MPIYARCSRCGKRIAPGTACSCGRARYREYDKLSRDKRSYDFYHSAEWIRTREDVLAMDGMDLWLYAEHGIIAAADTVHHIVPLKEWWEGRCDPENLISLSHSSHSEIESAYKTPEKEEIQRKLHDIVRQYRGGGYEKV